MSDLTKICPKCDAQSSDIGRAYRDGEGCPYCGMTEPAAAALWAAAYLEDRDLPVGATVEVTRSTAAGPVSVIAPVRLIDWTGGRGGGTALELEGLRDSFDLVTPSLPEATTLWRLVRVTEAS